MNIRYPNGKTYKPKKIENHDIKKQSFSNRGMTLEEDINESNDYYLVQNLAVIHKKPTPVQIVNVDYPSRSAAVIKEAYFKQASTTDYNGLYKGKYIDFEAKETRNKTSFPLKNFHDHQIHHLKSILQNGGIGFVLLRFTAVDEVYFLDAKYLFPYWEGQTQGGRKSIPKQDIERNGFLIPLGYQPRIDYLKIINEHYI